MGGEKQPKRLKPFLWFTLYSILGLGGNSSPVKISTNELADILGCSQQSASRHLKILEEMGLVTRRTVAEGSILRITEEGVRALRDVFSDMRDHFEGPEGEAFVFEGVVFSGLFEGAYYITQRGYREQILEKLGFDPYPGTLNVRLRDEDIERRRRLDQFPPIMLEGFKDIERSFGPARCYPLLINDEVEGALIVAERTTHDPMVIEIISPIYLRKHFGLRDGDTVKLSITSIGKRGASFST